MFFSRYIPKNVKLIRNFISTYPSTKDCTLLDLGLKDYSEVWKLQKDIQKEIFENKTQNTIIMVEHPSVYTLGRGATLDNVKFDINDKNYEIHRIERGGQVTYHNKGQLVVYPILNLHYFKKDLHWYMRNIEEVIINVLNDYGIKGYRIKGMTGVWVNDKKIAACGIHVNHWIIIHGCSINVVNDLSGFKRIIPCGLVDKEVCSIQQIIPQITLNEIKY